MLRSNPERRLRDVVVEGEILLTKPKADMKQIL